MTPAEDFFDMSRPSVRRSMLLLAVGALAGLAIAGYGLFTARGTRSHGVPPEAVALVNQRPVLRSDFMTQTQTQFAVPFDRATEAQRRKVLEDMIDEELMVQRGLEMDLPAYDPDVRNALVAGVDLEVGADVLARKPTEEQLRRYYEEHRERYASEGSMQLRDLVIADTRAGATLQRHAGPAARASDPTAIAALRDALRHAQPLEELMKRYGLTDSGRFMDAGHVDTGVIFDFSARAKLGPELYAVASRLRDGEVSEPVSQPDGVHLLVMVRRQIPVAQNFAQASDRVWRDLKNDEQTKVRAANLAYLRSRADIVVAKDYAR